MRKKVIIIGSIFMITIFIAIMGSGFILKNSFTGNDDVINQINLVQMAVTNDEWEQASVELASGFKAWEKVKNRIQFSVERVFIEDIDVELATLAGAIKAENSDLSIVTTEKIKILWKELGK